MALKLDYTNVMSEVIGPENGIQQYTLDDYRELISAAHHALMRRKADDSLYFYKLPVDMEMRANVSRLADELRPRFKNLVVIGIGGSSLGPNAVFSALANPYTNEYKKGGARLFFPDNIDPDTFTALLDLLKPEETLFNIITKSGNTVETLSQYLIVRNLLKKALQDNYRNHLIFTTDPKKSLLLEIAQKEEIRTLAIPPAVGGRFSVLSPVGLFPVAMAGIDINELLEGAKDCEARCETDIIEKNPAYLAGLIHFLQDTIYGRPIAVLMPYADALKRFGEWFCQLWAESLGKTFNRKQEPVFTGQTPVRAIGATDQHSQVQLYVEGPNDKVIAFIKVARFNTLAQIPDSYPEYEAIAYLGNRTLNDLLEAELLGTSLALTEAGRPNYTLEIDAISPYSLGELIMHFEIATAFSGELYNINAFDQPGVELGKKYACGLMGRKGYENYQTKSLEKANQKRYSIG